MRRAFGSPVEGSSRLPQSVQKTNEPIAAIRFKLFSLGLIGLLLMRLCGKKIDGANGY